MSDQPLLERTLQNADGSTEPAFVASAAAYARQRGTSRQAASKWNKSGYLAWVDAQSGEPVEDPATHAGDVLLDVAQSDARRSVGQNPFRRAAPAPERSPHADTASPAQTAELELEPASAPEVSIAEAFADGPADDAALLDARQAKAADVKLQREWMAARRIELQLRKDMGELVRRDEAERIIYDALRRVRDTMGRVAMDVCEKANPDEPRIARQAIQAEIEKKLTRAALEVQLALSGEDAQPDDLADEDADTEPGPDPDPATDLASSDQRELV